MNKKKKIDEFSSSIELTSGNTPAINDFENIKLNKPINLTKELISSKRNIKVELRTWNILRNLKRSNETFNDVILTLLKERTISTIGDNLGAIKYSRRTVFLQTRFRNKSIGIEFEYNDVRKEQSNFNLDLKIKKVFFGKRIMNPSEFFGVDNSRKYFHPAFLNIYFKSVTLALQKEFRVLIQMYIDNDFEDIALWKKTYYDNSLSQDSFISDIEEPLRLSEEIPHQKIIDNIKKSPSNSVWDIIK